MPQKNIFIGAIIRLLNFITNNIVIYDSLSTVAYSERQIRTICLSLHLIFIHYELAQGPRMAQVKNVKELRTSYKKTLSISN